MITSTVRGAPAEVGVGVADGLEHQSVESTLDDSGIDGEGNPPSRMLG